MIELELQCLILTLEIHLAAHKERVLEVGEDNIIEFYDKSSYWHYDHQKKIGKTMSEVLGLLND